MDSVGKKKQMQVLFSGRVQGVGFRYSVCRIAAPFSATGYVRNLENGDVEIVAEGVGNELLGFLRAIRKSRLGHYIFNEQLRWNSPTGKYKGFEVTF